MPAPSIPDPLSSLVPAAVPGVRSRQVPVAVVGIGSLTPGATDADAFWRTVLDGRDLISDVPAGHWLVSDYYDPDPAAEDKTYSRRGAFLSEVDFDPSAHGIAPNTLPATDTAQLLALIVAERVLDDLRRNSGVEVDRERVSVILGTGALDLLRTMSNRLQRPVWLKALRESGLPEPDAQAICDRISAHYVPWQEATFPGVLGNVVAGRIANRFDLHGTNLTVDAACASSLAAVAGAVNELAQGTADTVVTGGVDTLNDILTYMCFSKTPALSPSGDCRPFSDAADGTMLGEAVVMFALKRLADAERDGDRIYAVIRGVGSSSDGRGSAIYAPVPEGQARALRRAYEAAGYGPESVELVEGHGTGTKAGDLAEFTALRSVFDASGRADRQWCALGSAKSQLGHTKSAAGAVGLLKAMFALHHKTLPPTIKVERPNPALDLAGSPLYLNTQARPWIAPASRRRRASVSSFGFGGTNFHVTLEEYVPDHGSLAAPAPWSRSAPAELVLVSGSSRQALLERTRSLAASMQPLAETARKSQVDFDPADSQRLAVVAADAGALADRLHQAEALIGVDPVQTAPVPLPAGRGISYRSGAPQPGRLALLFSGQGSQYVGMGADLAMSLPQARAAWDRTAETWADETPLHRVVFPVPAFTDDERAAQQALLTETEWAQPALAVASLAQLCVLRAVGIEPDCVAGHSFGELVALHAAGVMDETSLVRLARRRGELMRAAATEPGAMLMISMSRHDTVRILAEIGADGVWIANDNSPRQVVLSGYAHAVEVVGRKLAAAGVATRPLRTAGAFHTPLMAPARDPFLEFAQDMDVKPPQIDVFGNADACPYPTDPESVRERIADHLVSPVRFADQIEAMYTAGVRTFVEVGAGTTLTGLVGQVVGERPHLAVSLDSSGRNGLTSLQEGLGKLATAGVDVDFAPLWSPYRLPAANERQGPRMTVPINGANYGSPYPPAGGTAALPPPNLPIAVSASAAWDQAAVATEVPTWDTRPAGADLAADCPLSSPASLNGRRTDDHRPAGPATTAAAPVTDDAWLTAVAEAHRQTAEAHATYLRVVADSHHAFLATIETSLAGLAGSTPRASSPVFTPPSELESPGDAMVQQAPPAQWADLPAAASEHPSASAGVVDVGGALIEAIAEKTGFPAEVIDPHMELEADLGIDSIKRVEILSALRRRTTQLADLDVDMAALAGLRTVDQISEAFQVALNGTVPNGGSATPASGSAAGEPAASAPVSVPVPVPVVSGSPPPLVRSVSVLAPAPAPGLELTGLRDGRVVVTDDGTGVAELLADRLREHGVAATAGADIGGGVRGVIILAGLRRVASVDEAIAVNREAFRFARSAAPHLASGGGVLVAVQDTGGDFGLRGEAADRAWLGGLAGLARTADKEWPAVHAKAIDCERGERDAAALADALLDELLLGGSQRDVGLRADGTRHVLAEMDEQAAQPAGSPRISPAGPHSVILATGGARGVTASVLRTLAAAHRPTVVLLGRTPLAPEPAGLSGVVEEKELRRLLAVRASERAVPLAPAEIAAEAARVLVVREIQATLAGLEAAGSRARYLAVDVRDQAALTRELAAVRQELGPVTGLIHGAGVLRDGYLANKTDKQFADVFDTKVEGLRALLEATEADPLNLVCVFTSVAGRFGNAGQSDYAMANEVIGQVAGAVAGQRPDCVVRALAWGPWDGGMVSPELRDQFRDRGTELIPLDAGAEAFAREVAAGRGAVRVTLVAGSRPDARPDAPERTVSGLVRVGVESHPYLADHALAGAPMLPLALAVEWFVGAARGWRPDADRYLLRDLAVLRRVDLDRFHDGGQDLLVRGCADALAGASVLRLDLASTAWGRHYSATVGTDSHTFAPARRWLPPAVRGAPPHSREVYGGRVLFHGPAFQAIEEVEALSAEGASATVGGVQALGWPGRVWNTDPAAIDAGLQLALLWAAERSQRPRQAQDAFLPMSVAEVRVVPHGPVGPGARCVVLAGESDALSATCDVALLAANGSPLAELLGVSLVRRPD